MGRPTDGDWRAGYVILEMGGEVQVKVPVVRVEYFVSRTAEAMIASDLPDDFADYLRTGGVAPTRTP